MQISQVMMSYNQPNFVQTWWKEISQPICIRNVDTLQEDSTKCAQQYELNSSIAMATYCVPGLPHIKSFSGTFGIPFWYLLTALHVQGPASI